MNNYRYGKNKIIFLLSLVIIVVLSVLLVVPDKIKSTPVAVKIPSYRAISDLIFEHVVIRVDDLSQATEDYQALGFTVVYGGSHGGGFTHNALIYFRDGTFVELIEYKNRWLLRSLLRLGILDVFLKNTSKHLKYRFSEVVDYPEGFIDSALLTKDMKGTFQQVIDRGLTVAPPTEFSRQRDNAPLVRWKIMSPIESVLPFVRDPYMPAIPVTNDMVTHKNGALGISQMVYGTRALEKTVNGFEKLLGITANYPRVEALTESNLVIFTLSKGFMNLSIRHEDIVLPDKRDGPVEMTIYAKSNDMSSVPRVKRFSRDKTHGAAINISYR